MYAVYKYVDRRDGKVKYVGKTTNLKKRIKQHERDSWFLDNTFDIYFIECKTKSDIDCLETIFINHYKSYNYYNIAKEWGEISFAFSFSQFVWIKFNPAMLTNSRSLLRIEGLRKEGLRNSFWEKNLLTLSEAAEYFNIGRKKIVEVLQRHNELSCLDGDGMRYVDRVRFEYFLDSVRYI